jgi:hypothetical protein
MKPRLINLKMIQNARKNIEFKRITIKQNNDYYINIFLIIVIAIFVFYMNYRYNNKKYFVKEKNKKKIDFNNQLLNYYNSIKRQEIMQVLNENKEKKFYNEYKNKIPKLFNLNKEWVKNSLVY